MSNGAWLAVALAVVGCGICAYSAWVQARTRAVRTRLERVKQRRT